MMERDIFDRSAAAAAESAASARSDKRDSMMLAAPVQVDGDTIRTVRVRNLSPGGLMAEYPDPVIIGNGVTVQLRGIGPVRGRIAWATDGRIGVAFEREIDPLLARKPVGKGAQTPVHVKPILPPRR